MVNFVKYCSDIKYSNWKISDGSEIWVLFLNLKRGGLGQGQNQDILLKSEYKCRKHYRLLYQQLVHRPTLHVDTDTHAHTHILPSFPASTPPQQRLHMSNNCFPHLHCSLRACHQVLAIVSRVTTFWRDFLPNTKEMLRQKIYSSLDQSYLPVKQRTFML